MSDHAEVFKPRRKNSVDEILQMYNNLESEADTVRDKDRIVIKGLFREFYDKQLNVGIGFQRAYGAMLSGDYFELFKLPDGSYMFVFADISGHGLPAYTTLIRLRSAITLSIKECKRNFKKRLNSENLVKDITNKFTDIMDAANSNDFASIIFTFIRNDKDKFYLKFYNRGMYFPFVVRKFRNQLLNFYDLNKKEKGWQPNKGHLLGSEIRQILGEKYNNFPSCEFFIYEGDSILFFSDGITEAQSKDDPTDEYGVKRLKNNLINNLDLYPQAVINNIFYDVYDFIGDPKNQNDDMTAVMISFPLVRA